MADCYYHGYSGGPGECPECAREDRANLEQGTLPPGPGIELTMDDIDREWRRPLIRKRKR